MQKKKLQCSTIKFAICENFSKNIKILSFQKLGIVQKNQMNKNVLELHFTSPYQISEP